MRTASIGGSGFPGRRFDSSKHFDRIPLAPLEAAAKRKRRFLKAVSVAVLKIKKFAANSSFPHALDYLDRRAVPIKFQFLLRFKSFVRSR